MPIGGLSRKRAGVDVSGRTAKGKLCKDDGILVVRWSLTESFSNRGIEKAPPFQSVYKFKGLDIPLLVYSNRIPIRKLQPVSIVIIPNPLLKIMHLLQSLALVAASLTLAIAQQSTPPANMYDTLAAHANNQTTTQGQTYGTFYGLAQRLSDIGNALKQGNTNRTLFAPTDDAFRKLNDSDPTGYQGLVANTQLLTNVLKYHLLAKDQYFDPTRVSAYRGFYGTELDKGQVVRIDVIDGRLNNGRTTLTNGVNSSSTVGTIPASNGVIYGIDSVLVPPYSFNRTLASKDSTSAFQALLQQANLTTKADSLQYVTIFVPNNAAILALRSTDANLSAAILSTTLDLHIVPRVIYSTEIPQTDNNPVNVSTAAPGLNVTVRKSGNDISVSGPGNRIPARVVDGDILFAGGVIHIIDSVLLPNVNANGTVQGLQGGAGNQPDTPVQPNLPQDNTAQGPIAGGGDVSNIRDVSNSNNLRGVGGNSGSGSGSSSSSAGKAVESSFGAVVAMAVAMIALL
ncbi:uncharacterized protein SPPG_07460 [Spizellomyces punctatus DAOM BR117]|uniref:FAS1 domain-containing protein n=1 Tax=Spizellomyces punctatus (strain DAOM BR117) TaxID=645134 RepID=A0A0L0H8T6_SPIPD|nr:uncharacterized protein SPPG_07460 [Spizellomyces punctatus DAOM BR117]KNC97063.1 hypothetical protein SPPG_07460 [Spizellomyces punctatus DAOM BR117]|eukprot:XP_016605103.1 hypothetical protein SPPG_07460 [Spizellomyces punctatus DAOM BR117]